MANVKPTIKSDSPKAAETVLELPSAPKLEVPEAIRAVAEKSVTQAKANFENIKTSAEEATDILEESYTRATKGGNELRVKALEATRQNVNAAFDFAVALTGVKSLSEAIELQTTHARKQFEAFSNQSKDLTQLATKIASDSVKPYQELVSKGFSAGR